MGDRSCGTHPLIPARVLTPRVRPRPADRASSVGLSQIWSRWSDAIVVVKPDTVLRWHRAGFRLFWRWKSRRLGQAEEEVSPEVKALIRRMAEANGNWGAPRIHGELLKLGIDIGERSVSRLMPKRTASAPPGVGASGGVLPWSTMAYVVTKKRPAT